MMDKQDRKALETLKRNWLLNPSWDLAQTEGFEDYRQELQIFQEDHDRQLGDLEAKTEQLAARFNASPDLVRAVLLLISRVEELEDQVQELSTKIA